MPTAAMAVLPARTSDFAFIRSAAAVWSYRINITCPLALACKGRACKPAPVICRNWKTFGPTEHHNDGDADFYSLSNKLSQQYEWFAPGKQQEPEEESPLLEEDPELLRTRPEFGLTTKQIASLGLSKPSMHRPNPASLSSKNFMRGDKFQPDQLGYNTVSMGMDRSYRAERFGNAPDLPSLLLQQRVIYISMPFVPSVTELVVAQCYYLDFDDKNRQKPIYVYLNSTGCINDKGQAISADNEFYAIWAALGFTRAPLYTGVTWKAQNQAAVLLSAGQKGHRYSFPHAKISTAPPVTNRVFGQTVDAQLQANELVYATKYYAAILARATGKPLEVCQKEYLSRKRYFSVKSAYDEGLIDKLVPGYELNRFRQMRSDAKGDEETFYGMEKPKFRFNSEAVGRRGRPEGGYPGGLYLALDNRELNSTVEQPRIILTS
eukprot:gene27252-2505_t